jgi:hypothetical protein
MVWRLVGDVVREGLVGRGGDQAVHHLTGVAGQQLDDEALGSTDDDAPGAPGVLPASQCRQRVRLTVVHKAIVTSRRPQASRVAVAGVRGGS